MNFTDDFLNEIDGFIDNERKESEGETPTSQNIVNSHFEQNISVNLKDGKEVLDPPIKEFFKNYSIFYDVIANGNYSDFEKLMSVFKKNDTIRERIKFFDMFHFSDSENYRSNILPLLVKLITDKVYFERLKESQKFLLNEYFGRLNRSLEKIGYPLKAESFNHNFKLYNKSHSNFISFFHNDNIFTYSANYKNKSNYYYLYKMVLNSIRIQNSINEDRTFIFYSMNETFKDTRNEALFFVMKRLFEEGIKFTCHKANAEDFKDFINVIYRNALKNGKDDKVFQIEKYIDLFNNYNDSEIKIQFASDINLFTLVKDIVVNESDLIYEQTKQKNVLKGLWSN